MLSFRPDATCALGFAAAGRRALPAVGTRAGKVGVTLAALASGMTIGAIAALASTRVAFVVAAGASAGFAVVCLWALTTERIGTAVDETASPQTPDARDVETVA